MLKHHSKPPPISLVLFPSRCLLLLMIISRSRDARGEKCVSGVNVDAKDVERLLMIIINVNYERRSEQKGGETRINPVVENSSRKFDF